jgi:hypothetical protein
MLPRLPLLRPAWTPLLTPPLPPFPPSLLTLKFPRIRSIASLASSFPFRENSTNSWMSLWTGTAEAEDGCDGAGGSVVAGGRAPGRLCREKARDHAKMRLFLRLQRGCTNYVPRCLGRRRAF